MLVPRYTVQLPLAFHKSPHLQQSITFPFSIDEPKFYGVNQYIPVDLNKSVTLTCNATGNPQPQIRWQRSDNPAPLSETTTLTISNIRRQDLGMYICEASALYGAFTTKKLDVYLLLKGTPFLMADAD